MSHLDSVDRGATALPRGIFLEHPGAEASMATADIASVPVLLRGVIDDARELIRDEIALAKLEAQQEVAAAKRAGVALGAGAALAVAGLTVLCVALAAGVADLIAVPHWVAFTAMAIVLAAVAYILISTGRSRLAAIDILPETKASLRDTAAWIQSKSRKG
jgi:hypothetical protein